MSLFRAKASVPVAVPQFTGLQIQTASSALPIPIVYGQTRLAPNLIWADHFQTHPQYTRQQSGKGGGQQTNLSGYTYSTAVVFALCEGPIQAIGSVYRGQAQHAAADFYLGFFDGATPQAPWGYLESSFPNAALPYQGTAYAASSYFDLGPSASIDSIAFELRGRLFANAGVNGHDADPAEVVGDFLTNAQYGVGFPAASLDATSLYGASGDGSYQTYCRALGLAFSPCLNDREAANATLARWLAVTNTAAVWSGGRLKLIPYGDAVVTGALLGGLSATYRPNTTPIYDLGDDDFVAEDGSDPLIVTRGDPYGASNIVRLEMLDRANLYSATPVEARDQNAIELHGQRIASTLTAHEICDTAVASIAAQLILQRGLYIRNSYSFRLSWAFCLLEPMDLVTLTDTGLGLSKTPVRIVAIEEDESGILSVTAEEYPGAVATAIAYGGGGAVNTPINRNVAASTINPPILFEPPADLTDGIAQVWVGVSGGVAGAVDLNWGGAVVFVSSDDLTYAQVGTITAPARQGLSSVALGASAPDRIDVDFSESGATLGSGVGMTAFCLVGAEVIAYRTATLSAASTYTLGMLERAVYGRQGGVHPSGTPVLCLDDAVFRYLVPDTLIGRTLYLKFASFNVFGGAIQDLATCVAYTIKPIGSGFLGPVSQAIGQGTALDEGLASLDVGETDTYGFASDPYTETVDMGLASDGAAMLAVAAGGTGATTAPLARQNIGAAASGANGDITSLTNLAALGVNTTADPAVNRLSVKSASVLFDNIGGGVQLAIDKGTAGDTGTVLYQTGYSGRASAGLLAGDRYRIAVSSNGVTFQQAVDIDPATGHVGLAGYAADTNNALGVLGTSFLFSAATDSCRFTFNKTSSGNDATLTFETGFSARAILGTAGSDQFQLKVSPDGSAYHQVFVVDQATGNLAVKALLATAGYTVSALPGGTNGALAFVSNGRKIGELSGSGTGVLAAFSNGQWRRLSDDAVVTV